MRISSLTVRSIVAVVLSLIAAVSLHRAPEYAWGGVTLGGQRYKFSAEHIYAIVPPGATPPAFMGCRWTAPRDKSQVCWPARGGTPAAWMIGLTPLLISVAAGLALVSAGTVLLGVFRSLAARVATRLLVAATVTALAAMLIPFATVTHAVGALHRGSVFFGALGTDYMLVAIVATALAWRLVRRQPEGQIARSTAATVAAA